MADWWDRRAALVAATATGVALVAACGVGPSQRDQVGAAPMASTSGAPSPAPALDSPTPERSGPPTEEKKAAVNVSLTGAARAHALIQERFDRTYAVLLAWVAQHPGSGYTNSSTDYAVPQATTYWVGPVPHDLVRRLAAVNDGVRVQFRAARYTGEQMQAAVDALAADFRSGSSASRQLVAVSPGLVVVSFTGRRDGSGLDISVAKTTEAAISNSELRAASQIITAHADLPVSVSRGCLVHALPGVASRPSPDSPAAPTR